MAMSTFDRAALRRAVEGIRDVHTVYPRLERFETGIIDLINRDNSTSEGNIHALIGPSRSGKSHLLDGLVAQYPRARSALTGLDGDFSDHIPVVLVKMRNVSTKAMAQRIYHALTERHPDSVFSAKYNEDVVVKGIIDVARECRTKLFILDEVHELIDRKTDKVVGDVAVLIKDLVNAKLFSILLVGTDKANRLIRADEEMEARTPVVYLMTPFGWANPEDAGVWLEILGDIDSELSDSVFHRLSGLCEPGLACALMEGAAGVVGHMATLLEQAAYTAVDEMIAGAPVPGVRWEHLEQAFAKWAPAHGRTNPFSAGARPVESGMPAVSKKVDAPADLGGDVASGARGRTRKNARDATFRK